MNLSPALRIAFALALAVVLGTTAVSYWSTRQLFEHGRGVAHTQDVLAGLADLLSAIQDAETGQRGYLLTNDVAFLQPYIVAQREVPESVHRLRAVIADDPEQESRLAALETHIDAKLAELRAVVDVARADGFAAAQARVAEGTGKREMDAIRAGIRELEVARQAQLRRRVRAANTAAGTAAATFAVAAALAAAFIGLLYLALRRQLAAQRAAAREREELLAREQDARRSAEEGHRQLEQANRAKDAFLATVSHELRTPLSPILAWTSMLEAGKLDPQQSRKALETIRRCARAEAQLVEDLVDVSRIIAGKLRLEVRPVDLGTVIESAVEVVRPAADAKGIRVQVILDTETAPVAGDPDRLQQVVWNLLSNAVKFTAKGGRVAVVLERVNSHVEIAVSDTGEGIDPAFLPYVFERFQQADTSSTRHHMGLGLGLAIVRHIVEAHGGTVHVESPGTGRGSVFTVKLPLVPIQRTAGELNRRHPTEAPLVAREFPRLNGLRVLVVDDEPDSNEVVRALLSDCGAEVRVAASAAQALDILDRWKPKLLVTDVGMPEEDGYGLLAKVRARADDNRAIPAIALTAYASVEDRVRLLSAGFAMHVPKPVEAAELLAVVARAAADA